MSLLACTTRRALISGASVPSSSASALPRGVLFETRRYASRKRWKAKDESKKSGVQRDASGKPLASKKEKTPPLFTPLPVEQLKATVFEVESRSGVSTEEGAKEKESGRKVLKFLSKNVKRENVGLAMEFVKSQSGDGVSKHFGLPKTVWKEFKLLGRPTSVVRDVTIDTVEALDKAAELSSAETRLVLSGKSGCGKSYLLVQAVEHCAASGWVVLYIPRAVNLVNSTTPYTYDIRTQTFLQPESSYQILHRVKEANKKVFQELKTQNALVVDGWKTVPAGTTLSELVDLPREEVGRAPVVLDWLMKELEGQTTHPVLLAVDDFQALFNRTAYRDPHFKPIAPYHMQVPRLLLEFAAGKRKFAKGAVVGALNASDPVYGITTELSEALELDPAGGKLGAPWPYEKRSTFLTEYAQGMRKVDVPAGLSVREAESVFEVWMKQRVLASKAYDELFMAKYVESAGNARDFVWKGLLGTLQT
ncbi:hypothetical protein P691DRAFT_810684 [Macrolepiota fuliginosa MF-IS2]|uniref:Small ribosomal subunit protein mS29 n=1 Tax=Macrolepiota fuliginosa MF-IS2 TaxID=1400762 RepID=A0A9P5X3X8_9AGAR|nr:hypothetical protein P691DRAFT_810684 [Macrolepiota fuliginosa MF-IS2]